MNQSAFLTGSTGFLGQHLCRLLIQEGWQVTAMCRSIPENQTSGVIYVEADLTNAQSLIQALPKTVDCVFHTAADTNTWNKNNPRQTQTNVQGTQNLMAAAIEKQAKKWLHVSSITTFGIDHHGMANLNEAVPQEGLSSQVNYVKTKSQAESMVKDKAHELNAIVVNPTHIIGPDDQHNWIRLFKMLINDDLPTVPVGAGSFVDVRDVAKGCLLAATKGTIGENYILGGHNLNFKSFIEQVSDAFDLKVTYRNKPLPLIKLVAKLKSAIAWLSNKEPDFTPESLKIISHQYKTTSLKAQDELGYQITPFEDTLQDIKKDLFDRGILRV